MILEMNSQFRFNRLQGRTKGKIKRYLCIDAIRGIILLVFYRASKDCVREDMSKWFLGGMPRS